MSPGDFAHLVMRAARELWIERLPGVVVSFLPLLALLALVLVPLAWQKGGKVFTGPLVAYLSTLGAALLCGVLLIRKLRIGFIRAAMPLATDDPSTKSRWLSSYLANEFNTELMIGLTLVIAAPVLGAIVGSRWARRSATGPGIPLALTASIAAPLCLTGVALVLHVAGMQWNGCGMSLNERYETMTGFYGIVSHGASVVFGCAAVGTLGVIAAALGEWSRDSAGSWRGLLACAALLALGLMAWVGTRNHAYDAAHPLPFLDGAGQLDLHVALPPAVQCTRMSDSGPIVILRPGGFDIDGIVLVSPYDVENTLTSKRELWVLLNPGKRFPGRVLFGAPADAGIDRVTLLVAAARRAGYADPRMLLALPVTRESTRTLGPIERTVIACEVALPSAWHEARTWGEVAESAGAAKGERAGP